MLQLKNNTPFATQLALLPNKYGIDTLYIIVKATFNIGQKWTLADIQTAPQGEDVYWGENPETSSIKLASDIHIGKPSTDIIMLGNACSLDEKNVTQMDVSLAVGNVKKTIHIFGDRVWDNGSISSANPFIAMPLVYERAYGGVFIEDGALLGGELRNPVGCGFLGNRKAADLNGLPVPNLETPGEYLNKAGDVVTPAGFSFISPSWQPRASFAGTYDDNWQQNQAPYLPNDFNMRFFNMAHPDLSYSGYLTGGEPVLINGMHPMGAINFNLPLVSVNADVAIKARIEKPEFNLETLLIDTNKLQISMIWKAALPCDKETLNIREVSVNLSRMLNNQAA